MLDASRGLPVMDFPSPKVGYVSVAVDASQQPYCLPNPFTLPQNIQSLEFIVGTEPTELCTLPTRCNRWWSPRRSERRRTSRS